MKRILFTAAIFCTFFTIFGQITPENCIHQLGKLPTATALVNCIMESQCLEKEEALARIERIENQAQAKMKSNATAMAEQIMNEKVAGTTVTNAEAAQMNQSDREALARQAAASQLGAMGISMDDLAKLQSGEMSEEELAAKMMQSRMATAQPQNTKLLEQRAALELAALSAAFKAQEIYVEGLQKVYETHKIVRQHYEERYHAKFVSYDKTLDDLHLKSLDITISQAERENASARYNAVHAERVAYERSYYAEILPIWLETTDKNLTALRTRAMSEAETFADNYQKLYSLTKEGKFANADQQKWFVATLYLQDFSAAVKQDYAHRTGVSYTDDIKQEMVQRENQAKALLQQEQAQLRQMRHQIDSMR